MNASTTKYQEYVTSGSELQSHESTCRSAYGTKWQKLEPDQARMQAMNQAGTCIAHALKEHQEGLGTLTNGSLVLGLRSGKIPVQLVQLPLKSSHQQLAQVGNAASVPTPVKRVEEEKRFTSTASRTMQHQTFIPQMRALSAPIHMRLPTRVQSRQQEVHHNPVEHLRNYHRNQHYHQADKRVSSSGSHYYSGKPIGVVSGYSDTISSYSGNRMSIRRDPILKSGPIKQIYPKAFPHSYHTLHPSQTCHHQQGMTTESETLLHGPSIPEYLSDTYKSSQQKSRNTLKMPDSNYSSMMEMNLLKNCVYNGQSGGGGGTLSYFEPCGKLTSDGRMQMPIPLSTGCIAIKQGKIPTTARNPRPLESLQVLSPSSTSSASPQWYSPVHPTPIHNYPGMGHKNLALHAHYHQHQHQHHRAETNVLQQTDTLNLVSDEEEEILKTEEKVMIAKEWKDDHGSAVDGVVAADRDDRNQEKVQRMDIDIDNDHCMEIKEESENKGEKSMECMQPLFEAIAIMEQEENQNCNQQNHLQENTITPKIKKGKRSRRRTIRKTGWRKGASFYSCEVERSHHPHPYHPSCRKISRSRSSFVKRRERSEIREDNATPDLDRTVLFSQNEDSGVTKLQKRKADATFCCVDDKKSIGGQCVDLTTAGLKENESVDCNAVLWSFLTEGCCDSYSHSLALDSQKPLYVKKATPCVALVLSESSFSEKNTTYYPASEDNVWNKAKSFVEGLSHSDLESFVQKHTLCGFVAAVLAACSVQ